MKAIPFENINLYAGFVEIKSQEGSEIFQIKELHEQRIDFESETTGAHPGMLSRWEGIVYKGGLYQPSHDKFSRLTLHSNNQIFPSSRYWLFEEEVVRIPGTRKYVTPDKLADYLRLVKENEDYDIHQTRLRTMCDGIMLAIMHGDRAAAIDELNRQFELNGGKNRD